MENKTTPKDYITNQLNEYVARMIQIRHLSSPEIFGIEQSTDYASLLLKNFQQIGVLAEQNRRVIQEIIDPILQSGDLLDSETIEVIRTLCDNLINTKDIQNLDLPLVYLLTERLLTDALAKDDMDYRIDMLDREIENCYFFINMTKRVMTNPSIVASYRQKGLMALEQLLRYLDKDLFLTLSEQSRHIVLTNSRYGATLYECLDPQDYTMADTQIQFLKRAIEIIRDPFYRNAAPNFDWKYQEFRIYEFMTQIGYNFPSEDIAQKTLTYADFCMQLWESDPDYYKTVSAWEEVKGRRLKIQYMAGVLSASDYLDQLYQLYTKRDATDYDTCGFDMNVEYPLDYLIYRNQDDQHKKKLHMVRDVYQSSLSYIFHMPKQGLLAVALDPYSRMLISFEEYPGIISFEQMGLCSFAALHPPTYVHSKMVANITRCLTRHLLEMKPDLFQDVFAFLKLPSTLSSYDAVIDFAYHAAICHDFGKLMIIDTIFVYGRKLFDSEFDLIKEHPSVGYRLLSSHSSTKKYADVARGHHLWFDGSRGYPLDFDVAASPLKAIIDIVMIADCMDAATDSVGRSYNKGKTLSDYEKEVQEGAGTRYAPWGVELLADEKTRQDLEYLLTKERLNLYAETYRLLSSL
jgi:HD-GYP domain-containing protein (c-di-GMP phosphodiesterase class II)